MKMLNIYSLESIIKQLPSELQKEVKDKAGNIYNQENSAHADISFAF